MTPAPEGAGLPFGPFHLPDGEFGAPYTAAFRALRPETASETLQAARAAGLSLIINLVGGRRGVQEQNGTFSLEKYKDRLGQYRSIDLEAYIADGTVIGHMMFDEPHDPSNWGGQPMPFEAIEAAAAYSKELWPSMPVGVGGPPEFLAGGAPWTALDFGFAQYTLKRGEAAAIWRDQQVSTARQSGLAVALGINVLHGNNLGPVTAEQLRDWGTSLAQDPNICALIFWRYEQQDGGAFFHDPAILEAMNEIAQVAQSHTAPPCHP